MRAALVLGLLALAPPLSAEMRLGGIAELAVALETRDGDAQKAEFSLSPSLEWRGPVELTAIARLRADAQDRLEPGTPRQTAIAPGSRRLLWSQAEAELRELYIDIDWGGNYLRLGKQQIVWGRADGLKILDQVNPQDFREFILADFAESRIPLWSLKWERAIGDGLYLQMLLVPDQTYHQLPPAGASYAIRAPELVPAGPAASRVIRHRPQRRLRDADTGLQLETRLSGWDLGLNALYHMADSPAVRLQPGPGSGVAELHYVRSRSIGGSAANAIGDFTLRLELAHSSDRHLPQAQPTDGRLTVAADELAYVVGLDWTGITDSLVSLQLFQSRVRRAGLVRGPVETDVSLLLESHFYQRVLRVRSLALHDLDQGDGLWSPALYYQWRGNLVIGLELDLFYGASHGRFGQFDDRDRLVLVATLGL